MCAVPRNACIPILATPPHPSLVFVCLCVCTDSRFSRGGQFLQEGGQAAMVLPALVVSGVGQQICVQNVLDQKMSKRRYTILQFRGAIVNISMHLLYVFQCSHLQRFEFKHQT